ncbi:MAG: hypothetical protein ACTSQY_03220 [Candidatus Odinarchaeia archaeon]
MPELDLDLFLAPEDVEPEAIVKITAEGGKGEIPLPDGGTRESFEIPVLLANGDKKLWTINLTSQRFISKQISKNTKDWIGRNIKVNVVEQNVRGAMKKVIYAKEVLAK